MYNHIDEIWSIDLADMIEYMVSNNKGYRYITVFFDNFSKHTWVVPLKNKKIKQERKKIKYFDNSNKISY